MMALAGAGAGAGAGCLAVQFFAVVSFILLKASDAALADFEGLKANMTSILGGGKDLPTWEKGLLKLTPVDGGPAALPPGGSFPLVLAAERTRRPDVLRKFRLYQEGWDITNKHYWASVAFTGFAGFLLALLWFVSFGLVFGLHIFCGWGRGIKDEGSLQKQRICLAFLLLFTCVASTGCILLCIGQAEFHDELLDTLNFVVNQSDFTVQILTNVTDFLSYAKEVNVGEVHLPLDAQERIDKLNVDLNDAAGTLSEKTNQNGGKIRGVIADVRLILIVVACIMLLLAILGFFFSVLGPNYAIYIFATSGWLLVVFTFSLCGTFMVLNNTVVDTCTAMNEWVNHPQAETALSSILPCVNEQTTNHSLLQSKEVIHELVNIVNTAISSVANSDVVSENKPPYFYNHSGSSVPYLCSPYDNQLNDQQCQIWEVSFDNASTVWQNYTCKVSDTGSCVSVGRLTPDFYNQLVLAVNVSYALYHYTPLLLNLENCNFVRQTFGSIVDKYCPLLQHDLRMVSIGLALISTGVILCLILWIIYANQHKKEGVCCAKV